MCIRDRGCASDMLQPPLPTDPNEHWRKGRGYWDTFGPSAPPTGTARQFKPRRPSTKPKNGIAHPQATYFRTDGRVLLEVQASAMRPVSILCRPPQTYWDPGSKRAICITDRVFYERKGEIEHKPLKTKQASNLDTSQIFTPIITRLSSHL